MEPSFDVDKLSYEIFSILESKFLFGYDDPKLFLSSGSLPGTPGKTPTKHQTPSGKVCILSIDGGGRASDGLLAGAALVRLESSLRQRSGNPAARIADFFDVAAGSGAGGVLAAMVFSRGPHGRPLFSAEEAMGFLIRNLRRKWSPDGGRKALLRGLFRRSGGKVFRKVFGEMTLRDTVGAVLIPCYDMVTGGPFLFSRADAVENEGFDFLMSDVCAATCAEGEGKAVEIKSVDGRKRIVAVGGGVAMGNPTAAAITHVLNNKVEFPHAAGVKDLLVVSIGSGEVGEHGRKTPPPSSSEIVRIAAEGVADMVDQAVAMAFGHNRTSNYIRIQATGSLLRNLDTSKVVCNAESTEKKKVAGEAEEMLSQKNIESVLFRGKKLAEETNAEKLEWFAYELVKEHDRRKISPLTTVVVKQPMTPRLSSETSSITTTATTTTTTPTKTLTSSPSYSILVGRVLNTIL
ncbi:patatin-like protein 3 [Typha angustifolia]|uniref:patatin-like protein 3 n=1 Tax=Typha angustifolia TaxID=59011 RepID=UPI003C2EBBEA